MKQVKDVMTRIVETASPNTTLKEAAQRMRRLDVGPLPVLEHQCLVGMVTDRDIVLRGVAEGLDPSTATVEQVLSPDVIYCFEDQTLEEAANIMAEHKIRRLIVVDHEERLAGIVSLGDLAVELKNPRIESKVLEEVSRPAR